MNFSTEQLKVIHRAVRYFQMNAVPLNGKDYQSCDIILNELFPVVKNTGAVPPIPPRSGFGPKL